MKVLVLGASGFVAGELIRQLQAEGGISIVAGVRRSGRFGGAIEERRVEARDAASLDTALESVTHAVNCIMGSSEAMIASTRNLLAAVKRRGDIRVVHMSSISVYGEADGDVFEDHRLGEGVDWYGAAKVDCETAVHAAGKAVAVTTLRPALIYGHGSALWSTRIARLLGAQRLGDLGAAGDGLCNLVHVGDVAKAIRTALTLPEAAGGTFNLADPEPPSWNAYLMTYAKALGATPVRRIPDWQMKLERKVLAPALKLAEIGARKSRLPLNPPPPITPGLSRLFDRKVRYDSGKADILFAGGRTPWREGVAEVAARINAASGSLPR